MDKDNRKPLPKLPGASRELDKQVAEALGGKVYPGGMSTRVFFKQPPFNDGPMALPYYSMRDADAIDALKFFDSWEIKRNPYFAESCYRADVCRYNPEQVGIGQGATLALAICAAILDAKKGEV